jgi:hypothetical protein
LLFLSYFNEATTSVGKTTWITEIWGLETESTLIFRTRRVISQIPKDAWIFAYDPAEYHRYNNGQPFLITYIQYDALQTGSTDTLTCISRELTYLTFYRQDRNEVSSINPLFSTTDDLANLFPTLLAPISHQKSNMAAAKLKVPKGILADDDATD